MVRRPSCILSAQEVTAVDRPSGAGGEGVEYRVRPLSDAAGLTQMGVKIREVPPGSAGTHLHFHDVEEEWAYVLSGRGRVELGPLTLPVRPGSFVAFPPGPSPHHFIGERVVAEPSGPLVLLEGGERRRDEDYCTYPELGVRSRHGVDQKIDCASLPAWVGDARQVVHLEDVGEQAVPHPLDPNAVRHQRRLHKAAGLQRQACVWVRLEPDVESTVFHTHASTDEWVYLLSGEAEARLGDETHPIGEGDFIGYPANGPAHVMRALSEVTYLMGGQSLPGDVVTYPERGMRLTSAGFESTTG